MDDNEDSEEQGIWGVVLPVADPAALAAALEQAQSACDALGANDALRRLMVMVLQAVVERVQPSSEQWAFDVPSRRV